MMCIFSDKGCLVEGPLNNLKKTLMELPKPKPITEREVRAHGYLNLAIFSNEANNYENEISQQSPNQPGGRLPPSFEDPQGAIYSNVNMVNTSIPVPIHMFSNLGNTQSSRHGPAFGNGE
jgi:hypothetical protein